MCPSCGLSHSCAEGQRCAIHSPCELGTPLDRRDVTSCQFKPLLKRETARDNPLP
jgi:hypothetical protein